MEIRGLARMKERLKLILLILIAIFLTYIKIQIEQ